MTRGSEVWHVFYAVVLAKAENFFTFLEQLLSMFGFVVAVHLRLSSQGEFCTSGAVKGSGFLLLTSFHFCKVGGQFLCLFIHFFLCVFGCSFQTQKFFLIFVAGGGDFLRCVGIF